MVSRQNYVSEKLGKWEYPTSPALKLPKHSWEMVANDEMWNGKVRYAMYAYEEALYQEKLGDKDKTFDYLELAYKLYSNVIESEKTDESEIPKIPAHWYKNVGIIHPKLVSLGMF